jgi:Fur family ferric uptake transcriptional regulator
MTRLPVAWRFGACYSKASSRGSWPLIFDALMVWLYTVGGFLLQEVALRWPMTCASEYAPALRSRGFRVTAQRMAILHVLRQSRGHLSPVQVYTRARRVLPGLTEPTVYRTLEFLANNRLVWPRRLATGHLVYEFAASNHHHLVCRECGAEAEIQPLLLENALARLEAASGYVLSADHMTLSGVCPRCQALPRPRG